MGTLAIINPKKRKPSIRAAKKAAKRRRENPAKLSRKTPPAQRAYKLAGPKSRRRARRANPIKLGSLKALALPALTGAAGAVVVHEAYERLAKQFAGSLPVALQSGMGALAVEAALAVGAGMVANKAKIAKPQTVNAAVLGALTVIGAKAMTAAVSKAMPGAMSGFQYIDTAALSGYQLETLPAPQMSGMPSPQLGYINSTPTAGQLSNVRDFRGARMT